NVHKQGAGDMYDKGQLVLNTLRSVIDNDPLWFSIIRGFAMKYRRQIVKAEDFFNYVNEKTNDDYGYFFDQYLKHTKVPVLQMFLSKMGDTVTARYRWQTDVQDFRMPVKVTTAKGKMEFINPTTTMQTMKLRLSDMSDFKVAEDLFLVDTRITRSYLDPRMPNLPGRR
ncbi:MAG: hypothetical protein WBD36_17205, partial [Bacteroidota bacterium]